MGITCSSCGKNMQRTIGTYHYRESGLDNVYLENIPVYECASCGSRNASIFRLGRLNDLIALMLVQKPAFLNGREIRFLRKNLRMPSHLFAKELGVGKTTLSKWEHDIQNHSEANDRLIRAGYIIGKQLRPEDQRKVHLLLRNISLKHANSRYVIVAEMVQDDYVLRYRPVVETQSLAFSSIDSHQPMVNRSLASSDTILGFKVVAGDAQTNVQTALVPASTAASTISEGITPYATQAAEI